MKAKDIITPADYEIRPYKGGERKVRIVRVEKVTIRVMEPGFFEGHNSQQWRAFPDSEVGGLAAKEGYPLSQVIRPWAEAEADHLAKAATEIAAKLGRQALEDALHVHGIEADVHVWKERYHLALTEDQAARLTDLLLRVAGEGRA